MIKDFEEYLIYEKRFSAHTVKAYLSDISQFSDFIKEREIENFYLVHSKDVRRWIVELVENDIKSSSIHRKLSAVKTFYRLAIHKGLVKTNPAKNVYTPKLPQRLPKYIDSNTIENVLKDVEPKDNSFSRCRDWIVIEVLYDLGLRRQELVNLKWEDIDQSLMQIRIFGKGGKERVVPMGSRLKNALDTYADIVANTFGVASKNSPVILTDKGVKTYPELIYRIVRENLKNGGVKIQKSPHVLRHTFATHMANNGAPLNDVKELLGHASLASTQIYTHNTIEKLKEIFKNSHPKA
ncbi:MAG: tyrosine-type recombinase/integrase [Chitinophagales bacterium]|nr:tyrosine-type recombinase/integrase [Chitinophagales bacterium]